MTRSDGKVRLTEGTPNTLSGVWKRERIKRRAREMARELLAGIRAALAEET